MEESTSLSAKKPAILMAESDYNLIANYAASLDARSPGLAQMLFDEIDRAEVCPDGHLPIEVVMLGSNVSYHDSSRDEVRTVQLVMPSEADIEDGKISIVTHVAAGLIGLKAGQSIDWPCPDGRARVLRILDVTRKN